MKPKKKVKPKRKSRYIRATKTVDCYGFYRRDSPQHRKACGAVAAMLAGKKPK